MFYFNEGIISRIPSTLSLKCFAEEIINGRENEKSIKKNKKKNFNNNQKKKDENGETEIQLNNKLNDNNINLDLKKCKQEYEILVKVLRELNLDIIELPPDNSCNLSFFLGDLAFCLNGTALLMKPKASSRLPEVNTIRTVLRKELNLPEVIEIEDEDVYVEGGDILFTGREIFVGISKWTNLAGARYVAQTFPEYPTTPIKVCGDYHLTHYIGMASAGEGGILSVGEGKECQDIIKRMEKEASFNYQKITTPEEKASQILFVNGTLLHMTSASYDIYSEKLPISQKNLGLTELSKLNVNFSRMVVLINKSTLNSII